MAAARTITVRGVPDPVLRAIRARSAAERRSLNAELLTILERAASEGGELAVRRVGEAAPRPYARAPRRTPSAARPSDPLHALDRGALGKVCRRHHVASLAVFGSSARGDAGPDSDVDLVVAFEPGMAPGFGIVTLADALSGVFGGRRVDLVTLRGLRPPLRELIATTSVSLYGA